MADINKNDNWQNRKSHGGKGDFHAGDMRPYRAGSIWGVSDCCGSPVAKLNGHITCEKCLKVCIGVSKEDFDMFKLCAETMGAPREHKEGHKVQAIETIKSCLYWDEGLCCYHRRRSFLPESVTGPCTKSDNCQHFQHD